MRRPWGGLGLNSGGPLDIINRIPPTRGGYYPERRGQQKMFWQVMRWSGWNEPLMDGRTGEGTETRCWYTPFAICPHLWAFLDYFKVWVEINKLIVYQDSIYLKKKKKRGEIGKAIFSLCSKVSCVMQLAMTTKLMVLWSRSQWVLE